MQEHEVGELYIEKILKRYALNKDEIPSNLKKWQDFVDHIKNLFIDFEQERYLLERSMEISSREMQDLNNNIEKSRSSMISLSRQAGMSEIATTVLHNVGNVLNSINLSVSLIDELNQNSEIENLIKVCQMVNDNISNPDYFTSDIRGKLIPKYLIELSKILKNNSQEIKKEIINLNRNLEHINNIVMMQKDISGVAGVTEKIYLAEVVDLAIKMAVDVGKYGVNVMKNYEYDGCLLLDKAKLLQILINLIRNAKESMSDRKANQQNNITITIHKVDEHFVEIQIKDNGIGIAKTNLTKIFTMGFTTKSDGHGFGLHSSALAARELGGSLRAESQGIQQGATFILTLPNNIEEKERRNE